jgi:hypothetical protein
MMERLFYNAHNRPIKLYNWKDYDDDVVVVVVVNMSVIVKHSTKCFSCHKILIATLC